MKKQAPGKEIKGRYYEVGYTYLYDGEGETASVEADSKEEAEAIVREQVVEDIEIMWIEKVGK